LLSQKKHIRRLTRPIALISLAFSPLPFLLPSNFFIPPFSSLPTYQTQKTTELESYAATSGPLRASPRTCTSSELTFLLSLHAKYGTDLAKASRDIRLNRLQKTKGELERSLKRAGGWEGVLEYGREVADVLNV
jgi:hypothetical protein